MRKIGILGGGQLGRMMLQQAVNYPVETWVMENDEQCPSASLCHRFVKGDIRDREAVIAFGRQVDALTIEIENVSLEALQVLESEGIRVFPNTKALGIIKNKILQKEYYRANNIPTSAFRVLSDRSALQASGVSLPAVQKLATGGYDGRGVMILRRPEDLASGFDAPSVLEEMVEIERELAIIVAIDERGGQAVFPPVEMAFNPEFNLLDYQLCPPDLPRATLWKAEAVAQSVARNLGSPGLFAVELFVDRSGEVLVNETAPRVHNSGHHSIEGNFCSQFDMLLRIVLGYPLGDADIILPSAMINLVGADGYEGEPVYEGLEDVMAMERTFVHIYGKRETRPGRKMGHVTVLANDRHTLIHQAERIRETMKVKGTIKK
ncbi:MAG: 5-(carboxyamino)imidazole ribonucleotide synthase [Chitinophagaceae bacterium]|jgi:5-(carboxyamino)imidazole ribonucleotide synthase|nr:5-(carboxyamino)imidazole ribonucleotide synthase [Chitinophagaceae bacterium]